MCDFRDLEVTELKVRHRQLGYIYIYGGLGHDVGCVSWYMNTRRHYSYFTEERETQTGDRTAQGQ